MSKRVLIFDDDEDVLDVMQEAFRYEGFIVSGVKDSNNILAEIKSFNPDVVLLDYICFGINGGEICHQIKENPKTLHLPVILVSAYPMVLKSLGDYGCDDFIAKPFDLEDLTRRVRTATVKTISPGTHAS